MRKILMAENSIISGNPFRVGGHHFARMFSESGAQVLYLSPPVSLLHFLGSKRRSLQMRRLAIWRNNGMRLSATLEEYVPFSTFPLANKPFLNSDFCVDNSLRFTIPGIIKFLKHKGFLDVDILLISELQYYKLATAVKSRCFIYRKTDDYQGFSKYPKKLLKKEKLLVETADRVIVTANALKDDIERQYGRVAHYIPNGVDFGHFQEIAPVPPEYAKIPKPIAVYVGAIDEWLDVDLLRYCACQNPQRSFVIIGPPNTDISPLKRLQNVYLLGARPYSSIPAYLQHADVGMIPFKPSGLLRALSPIKAFEYLASGLPVVSTGLQELISMNAPVLIASSKKEFNALLGQAIASCNKTQYVEFARRNSWEARFAKITAIIDSCIKNRASEL